MDMDDDLFEDNDVVFLDEPTSAEGTVNDEIVNREMADYNPDMLKYMQSIRDQLSNTDAFSFSFYPSINCVLLDFAGHVVGSSLSEKTSPYVFSNILGSVNENMTYEQCVKYREFQRNIVQTGYFIRIVEHFISMATDHPALENQKGYLSYVYNLWVIEHKMATMYLAQVIDQYVDFCTKYDIEVDQILVEEQMFNYLSTLEQIVYGKKLQAFNLEGIGSITEAEDERDRMCQAYGQTIYSFSVEVDSGVQSIVNEEIVS